MHGERPKMRVNQEITLRPLASETTGQSKVLGLAAKRFVSDRYAQHVLITYIVTPAKVQTMSTGIVTA
jgi:hypothetical protein